MNKTRQEYREVNGIRKAICPLCNEIISYPDGLYFRNGIEVHNKCIAIARMRRGKILEVDR
jgi:hypothetical protein